MEYPTIGSKEFNPAILPHVEGRYNSIRLKPTTKYLQTGGCYGTIARNVPRLAMPCGWLQVGTGPLAATSQNQSCF